MKKDRRRILHKRRWIKQRDQHSCVPIAILNILKWAGYPATYRKDCEYWRRKVKHTTDDGAHIRDYGLVLSMIPEIRAKKVSRPSVDEIDTVLSEGNVVLLRSAWRFNGDLHRHLLLIVGRTDKSWFLTNTFRGHAWFPKPVAAALYMEQHRSRSGVYPTAWFISRVSPKE
jgi:hypothetical protein